MSELYFWIENKGLSPPGIDRGTVAYSVRILREIRLRMYLFQFIFKTQKSKQHWYLSGASFNLQFCQLLDLPSLVRCAMDSLLLVHIALNIRLFLTLTEFSLIH